jgi:tetratricopeptide (TPR) repeat protein
MTVVETPQPPLSPEDEAERRERAEALLVRARAFAAKGGHLEAISTVEEAAGISPGWPTLHSELADLYESIGSFDKAIAAQKRAVALTPDCADSRERLEVLQRSASRIAEPSHEAEEPPVTSVRYWAPRLGAALAGALVLGSGFSLLSRPAEPDGPGKKSPPGMSVAERLPGNAPGSPALAGPSARQTFVPLPPTAAVDPFVSKGYATPAPTPRRTRQQSDNDVETIRRPRRRSLPRPEPETPPAAPVPPISVSVPASPTRSVGGGAPLGGLQQTPPSERISAGPPPERPARRESEDNGYIKIESHPASENEKSPPERSESESGDPAQAARALQGAGRYRDAVVGYREAIAQGGAAGELHQNLALCYQRIGDLGAARDAYAHAIDAYTVQLRREGDSESARRGIASCRAALEVLRDE